MTTSHTPIITLSDEVIEAVADVLAELDTLDADELVVRLEEWSDEFRASGVLGLDWAIAVARNNGPSVVFLQYGIRLLPHVLGGNVIVIDEHGGYEFTSWQRLRGDHRWSIDPGDSIIAMDSEDAVELQRILSAVNATGGPSASPR